MTTIIDQLSRLISNVPKISYAPKTSIKMIIYEKNNFSLTQVKKMTTQRWFRHARSTELEYFWKSEATHLIEHEKLALEHLSPKLKIFA